MKEGLWLFIFTWSSEEEGPSFLTRVQGEHRWSSMSQREHVWDQLVVNPVERKKAFPGVYLLHTNSACVLWWNRKIMPTSKHVAPPYTELYAVFYPWDQTGFHLYRTRRLDIGCWTLKTFKSSFYVHLSVQNFYLRGLMEQILKRMELCVNSK